MFLLLEPAICFFTFCFLQSVFFAICFSGAVSYVSCCYTVVSVIMVIILFIQQIVLISQNITMQEFNAAVKQRSLTSTGEPWWKSFYVSNNKYNRGIRANWMAFIRRTRHELPPISLDSVDWRFYWCARFNLLFGIIFVHCIYHTRIYSCYYWCMIGVYDIF